eukprot:gene9065-biopygen13728
MDWERRETWEFGAREARPGEKGFLYPMTESGIPVSERPGGDPVSERPDGDPVSERPDGDPVSEGGRMVISLVAGTLPDPPPRGEGGPGASPPGLKAPGVPLPRAGRAARRDLAEGAERVPPVPVGGRG